MISQKKEFLTVPGEAPPPSGEAVRDLSVLLAEDDPALRRYLEIVLKRAGYRVIPASDGLEAMKAAFSSAIDIVVTDAVMPNLDGNELCRFFRSTPQFSHIPLVLLSALERKDATPGLEPDAFIAKPISPEQLLECLEEMLLAAR